MSDKNTEYAKKRGMGGNKRLEETPQKKIQIGNV